MIKVVFQPIIKRYRLHISLFIILSIISRGIPILIPYITGRYIDAILIDTKSVIIYKFSLVFFIVILIQITSSYFFNIVVTKLKNNVSFSIINYLIEHIKRLPLSYFKDVNPNYLCQKINMDSNIITAFAIDNVANCVLNIMTFAWITYYIFNLNIKLALILLIFIPVYIIEYMLFKKPLYKYNLNFKENQNNLYADMNDQISNIKLTKLNSWFDETEDHLRKSYISYFKSSIKYTKVVYLFNNIGVFLTGICSVLIFFVGGILVSRGVVTIGNFISVITYYKSLFSAIGYFLNLSYSYQEAVVSYKRLMETYNTSQEHNGEVIIEDISSIEIENLSFSYHSCMEIFSKFNYTFERGNIYCIVGKNGVGKSTLLNILVGLNNEYSGQINYNFQDITQVDLYNMRKNCIGITEQEPKLINDTLLNNITYGLKVFDIATIESWCDRFNLNRESKISYKDFLNANYNYKTISGGEKQKISIIRTLIKNPQVIVLDEPTSSLDKYSIEILKNTLVEIKEKKIIIIITHDQSFCDISDYIINI